MHILHIYILQISVAVLLVDMAMKESNNEVVVLSKSILESFYQKKLAFLYHVIRRTSLAEENELIDEKWVILRLYLQHKERLDII